MEDESASMLPPPPPEKGQDTAASTKPQTEADKILEKYADIGKQQEHVYGALGSSIPNFNLKPGSAPANPTPANPAKEQAQAPVKPPVKPPVAAPAVVAESGILGARPAKKPAPANPAPATVKRQNQSEAQSANVLPLGAPRHRTPPAATPKPPAADQE